MSETIEKLEGVAWGEPEYDSNLVTTCHQLRKKPIDEFGIEDLRVMIGQNIGTKHLMPRALKLLRRTRSLGTTTTQANCYRPSCICQTRTGRRTPNT